MDTLGRRCVDIGELRYFFDALALGHCLNRSRLTADSRLSYEVLDRVIVQV